MNLKEDKDSFIAELASTLKEETEKQREGQAKLLCELVLERCELWHTPEEEAFATLLSNGHPENYSINSWDFRQWCVKLFFERYGKPPNNQALQDSLRLFEAKAHYEGREYPVFIRVAEYDGSFYLDLGDKEWQVVSISPQGWQIIQNPPVRFRRARGMLALPLPQNPGRLNFLRDFLNISDEETWILILSWLVGCFRPKGPYSILVLQGEQGSGKSTTARILRSLIDPNVADIRGTPREERDLVISANNSWVMAFDNLSGIPIWLSDALCRIASGAGFSTRTLYSDKEETIFCLSRPIVCTSIDDLANRHDFLDRAILVNLPPISEARRRDEATLGEEFEKARPYILAGILDVVSCGLRNWEKTKLFKIPRMADFARWVVACEEALPWERDLFLQVYEEARGSIIDSAIENDLVAEALMTFILEKGSWEGTAKELLEALSYYVDENTRKKKEWPGTPRGMSGKLRRIATFLRHKGVEIDFQRLGGKRNISIRKSMPATVTTVTTATNTELTAIMDCDAKSPHGDIPSQDRHTESSLIKPLCDHSDDSDGGFPNFSNDEVFEF